MNPEFERNLWLEAGPRRIAWAAVVQAAIYAAAVAIGSSHALMSLGWAGVMMFVLTALLWGPRLAGRAVADEVVQRTWDFQRLSALDPWSMAWGKLLGATSLAWFAAAVALGLAAIASVPEGGANLAAQVIVAGLGAAVLLQAGSMALALVGVRRARAEGRVAGFRFTFGGVIGLMVMVSVLGRGLAGRGGSLGLGDWFSLAHGQATWWGVVLPSGWFAVLSLAVFAGWTLIAAWRLMRLELQMDNAPWAWPLFVLFAGLWAAGLAAQPIWRFATAGAVFAVCAYASAFAEPADRVRLRGFVTTLRAGALTRAGYAAPAVIAPAVLAALAVLGVALSPASTTGVGLQPLVAFGALAFLLRDIAIVGYFRFGPRPKRGDFGAVLALFLSYFVGGVLGANTAGAEGAALFSPSLSAPMVSILAGTIQAVVIAVLTWRRIRAPEHTAT